LFGKWITKEVLLSLRRRGYYELEAKYESKIEVFRDRARFVIENSVNERFKQEIQQQVKAGPRI
jgi:prophage antirepressor-like protein